MLILQIVVSYMHMSEETQTTQPETKSLTTSALDDALEMQLPSEAAQRILGQSYTSEVAAPEAPRSVDARKQKQRRALTMVAAGVGATVAAGALGLAAGTAAQPQFSEESHTFTVEDGQGLQHAAEDVLGVENVDIADVENHIKVDPSNVDVFQDGVLKAGETLNVPDHVE